MREPKRTQLIKIFGFMACMLMLLFNIDPSIAAIRALPGNIYVDAGLTQADAADKLLSIKAPFKISVNGGEIPASHTLSETLSQYANGGDDEYSLTVELMGIRLKTVNVHMREEVYVMPGGEAIGVTMFTSGALVVGLGGVETENGKASPAADAGVAAGDVIVGVNGSEVESAAHLGELCNAAAGGQGTLRLTLRRAGEAREVTVTPALDMTDGQYKLGMWVRDSTAGIGTLSFYVMSTQAYGALGHAVTDVDTGSLLSVKSGSILSASIVDVAVGASGAPGEIRGAFSSLSKQLGTIEKNCAYGIFGVLDAPVVSTAYPHGLPLAYPDEVKLGRASLLTTINESGVCEYECEIVKLYPQDASQTKGLVVEITDERLLSATGGIVQGMSGSPVIQNGKLVGAVTHVFVNDPSRGYCVYSLWMLEECVKQKN